MFDLDDDIGLDSYRIHWLIWIQILIMFLLSLTILLSYLGLFTLDSSSKSDSVSLISSSQLGSSSNCPQTTQVEGHRDGGEVNTASGNSNSAERDGSARKSLASALNDERVYHPCTYFDLAKQAFLKCLGLGSKSPNTPDKEHDHQH